jgi:hypothetical protein
MMAEKRSNHMGPRDYDGGESIDSFHSNFQILRDIDFLKKILPSHYVVQESNKRGSVHCKSKVGIRLYPSDQEDEEMWGYITKAIKQHFGDRFQEVFHNTCFCHVDFTVYLKK